MDAYDYFTGHVLTALGFIGITDVKLVRLEGVNADPDSVPAKTADAEKAISEYLSA